MKRITWLKRYTSFSLDEIRSFRPFELEVIVDELNEILKAESDAGG